MASASRVWLADREVLFRQAEPMDSVYFPVTAVASLVALLRNGSAIELSTIGNEGMTGAPLLLGFDGMTNAAGYCQIEGHAIAVRAADFIEAVGKYPELHRMCLNYVGVLVIEIGQGVACSRLHTTEQRCARWLLATHDRVGTDRFHLTHEFLGVMLGSRRASVSEALAQLNNADIVRSHRGAIEILDRLALERLACECYAVVRQAIDGLYERQQ